MPVAEPTARTVAEFLELPDHERYELIDGELRERDMNPEAVWTITWIAGRLLAYCSTRPQFLAFGDGVGYTLGDASDAQYRKPDASVVLRSRLPGGRLPATAFDFAPDFAVEVASPSDSLWELESKVQEYLAAGSQLVWMVRPAMRRISAYTPDGVERTFGPDDLIAGEPVLPGFSFRVGEVFPPAELRA